MLYVDDMSIHLSFRVGYSSYT